MKIFDNIVCGELANFYLQSQLHGQTKGWQEKKQILLKVMQVKIREKNCSARKGAKSDYPTSCHCSK